MLFTLKIKLANEPLITISVFEGSFQEPNHTRLDIEVRQAGNTIFRKGELYCGISALHSIDGKDARRCVLTTVGMYPGCTDKEYFETYSPEQKEWSEYYGELLHQEAEFRYS